MTCPEVAPVKSTKRTGHQSGVSGQNSDQVGYSIVQSSLHCGQLSIVKSIVLSFNCECIPIPLIFGIDWLRSM